jgi:hypothetical protein
VSLELRVGSTGTTNEGYPQRREAEPLSELRVHIFLSVLPRLMTKVGLRFAELVNAGESRFALGASLPEILDEGESELGQPAVALRHWLSAKESRDDSSLDFDQLEELEEKFSPITIAQVIASDNRHNQDWTRDELLRFVLSEARLVGDHLDSFAPDVVILTDVSCIPSYVLWLLSKDRGIPVVSIGRARTQNRIWYRTGLYEENAEYTTRFDELVSQKSETALSGDDQVGRYLSDLESGSLQEIASAPLYQRPPSVSFTDLRTLWSLARVTRQTPDNRVTYGGPSTAVARRLRRIGRHRISSGLFDSAPPEGEYAFFALHVQPEASTEVLAPWFVDQVAVIRQIALSLPVGWNLVVKEHLPAMGRRPVRFYRDLLAIPNVRLLSPRYPSLNAIGAAQCVATITGTVGWEAWCMGKPVALFGETRYSQLPGVFRVQDPRELRSWFSAVEEGTAGVQTMTEKRAAVRALLDVTVVGSITPEAQDPASLKPENVDSIARGLLSRYQWILERRANVRQPVVDLGAANRSN